MGPQQHEVRNENHLLPDCDNARTAKNVGRQIEIYCADLGHSNVRRWVERVSAERNRDSSYEIRSNLVGGLPPVGPGRLAR
jgi:hypothetical protein